ncbi:MAG TPA: hypothetical protein VJQ43_01055 [Thermoplasmata archaeon]|nr:hypothetical protein [Thermoplasmata archaeon]
MSGPTPRPHRRRAWLVVVAVVATIVLAAALVVPVRTSSSLSVASEGLTPSVEYRDFPAGSPVRYGWGTEDGRTVTFTVLDSQGHPLDRVMASSGNGSFVADGKPYGFSSYSWLPEVVDIHGSFAAPVLR